jgi:hypothetical protein
MVEKKFAFAEAGQFVFDNEVEQSMFQDYAKLKNRKNPVRHSMVVIGVHADVDSDKVWFLLQNCWKNKYFFVVSAEYLASCEGRITFVNSADDVSLKDSLDTVDGVYVEHTIPNGSREIQHVVILVFISFAIQVVLQKSTCVHIANTSPVNAKGKIVIHCFFIKEYKRQCSPRRAIWNLLAEFIKLYLKCCCLVRN